MSDAGYVCRLLDAHIAYCASFALLAESPLSRSLPEELMAIDG